MSSGHHGGTMRIDVPAGRTPGQLNKRTLARQQVASAAAELLSN
jgi:hypothetical protein